MDDNNSRPIDVGGLQGPEWNGNDEGGPTAAQDNPDGLWRGEGEVVRPARVVPVIHDVDVAVVGAGVAGVIAALAAAREGAHTLIIEEFSTLGGNMGPGMFAGGSLHLALNNPEAFPTGLGGIPAEFNGRIVGNADRNVGSSTSRRQSESRPNPSGSRTIGWDAYLRDSHAVSFTATTMLEEAGAVILLSAMATDPLMEAEYVRGIIVETKSGSLAIKSRVLIDCTGTADIAERAGAAVVTMPVNPSGGVYFRIAGVNTDAFEEAKKAYGAMSVDDQSWLDTHAPGQSVFMPWIREAAESDGFAIVGRVDDFATLEITVLKPQMPGTLRGRTRINGRFHPGDALAVSLVNQRMHSYLFEFAAFLKDRVPGCADAYLEIVSPFTHFRGGKSIDSVQTVGPEEVKNSARFDDVIYIYYDDKHGYRGGCDIPYRMLLPKKIEGLLAAGKSAVRRGPQIRQRHSLQLMGQAAGVAAALAVRYGVEPRDIDIRELQRRLRSRGCEMGPEARLRELGIE